MIEIPEEIRKRTERSQLIRDAEKLHQEILSFVPEDESPSRRRQMAALGVTNSSLYLAIVDPLTVYRREALNRIPDRTILSVIEGMNKKLAHLRAGGSFSAYRKRQPPVFKGRAGKNKIIVPAGTVDIVNGTPEQQLFARHRDKVLRDHLEGNHQETADSKLLEALLNVYPDLLK